MQNLFEKLNSINGLQLRLNEPLSLHTGFRTGGSCSMVLAQTEAAFCEAITVVRAAEVPYFVLGRGSNVLAADEGYSGIVIKYVGDEISVCGTRVTVAAGASLATLCRAALQNSLTGLEFAYGIPGSVGGAVFMNAGAYDGQMADVLASVRIMDAQGCVRELAAEELKLSYRHSIFHEQRDWVILSAAFELKVGEAAAISARMEELMARRIDKQPLDYPSCGSTFKRPEGAYASKLIDDCGLKGLSVGGAQVSKKHSGFVINRGGATSSDILQLCANVKEIVKEKTGFELELEVELLK
ncbi:MAG: UDP-N-acetylmuramate dehydrogenase [Oscillospiraceae bacterium]|nr:UDP-N-acetylmuramate dehydrogenase [Oscillospiraceae bacterium]